MSIQTRLAPNDVRKPRDVLSLKTWRGRNCSKLAGGEQTDNTENHTELQRWEQQCWDARNAWSIRRTQGIFGTPRKLDKQDADRALKRALAVMAEGGEI
ncbi:MAG: hypothetical protein R3E21_08310 [Caenibius sp.]